MTSTWYSPPRQERGESMLDSAPEPIRGDRLSALAGVLGGVVAGIGLRVGWPSRWWLLVPLGLVGAVFASNRVRNVWSAIPLAGAVVLGALIVWHPGGWVGVATAMGSLLLASLGAVLARAGGGDRLGITDALRRAGVLVADVISGPILLAQAFFSGGSGEITTAYATEGPWNVPAPRATRDDSRASILRGVLLAVLVVAVLWWLLAAGDAVIDAAWIDLSPVSLLWTVLALVLGVWVCCGFVRTAGRAFHPLSWGRAVAADATGPRQELLIVCAAVAVSVFFFAVIQAFGLAAGIDSALRDAGQTRADSARAAFMQVGVVAVAVWVLVGIVRSSALRPSGGGVGVRVVTAAMNLAVIALGVTAIVRAALAADETGWDRRWVFGVVAIAWVLAVCAINLVILFAPTPTGEGVAPTPTGEGVAPTPTREIAVWAAALVAGLALLALHAIPPANRAPERSFDLDAAAASSGWPEVAIEAAS